MSSKHVPAKSGNHFSTILQIYEFNDYFCEIFVKRQVIVLNMVLDILKGFIIGICASAPIGPIAILVIQKTLGKGHKAGFITGLGASCVDTTFSVIALFALAIAQDFLNRHKELILVCGGVLVAVIGWFMLMSDPFRKLKSQDKGNFSAKDFLQSLAMGFSNPGAILAIFALFAFFGIGPDEDSGKWTVLPVILAVFAGTVVYWFCITAVLEHFRKRIRMRSILWINRITGLAVILIGLTLLGEGLYRVVFLGIPLN